MKIVASSQLGKVGAAEGQPVLVQWRWFDSKPTLALWIALAAMLVLPKQNRSRHAWLILVVPLTALPLRLFCLMPTLASSAGFDLLIQVIVSFAVAWAIVWLAMPYLSIQSRRRNLLSIAAVMLAAGLLAYLGYFGFWIEFPEPVMVICFWCVGSLALAAALQLSGISCRGKYHTGKFALWFVPWLLIATMVCLTLVLGTVILIVDGPPRMGFILAFVVQILIISGFLSGLLYLINLPVLLLAGRTDCYRDRLRRVAICQLPGASPFIPVAAAGDSPAPE